MPNAAPRTPNTERAEIAELERLAGRILIKVANTRGAGSRHSGVGVLAAGTLDPRPETGDEPPRSRDRLAPRS